MQYVKEARLKLGLTKYAFAKKVHVAWNTVYTWERFNLMPKKENKEKIDSLLKETK